MIKPLNCGVRRESSGFRIDFGADMQRDIIKLMNIEPAKSTFMVNVYFFGYSFTCEADSKDRGDFMTWLKTTASVNPMPEDVRLFLERPILKLKKHINLQKVSALVYPASGRNELDRNIARMFGEYMPHTARNLSFELIKNLPENVEFDMDAFDKDYSDNKKQHRDMVKHVRRCLMPAIHTADYFSLSKCVKVKYRPYIMNYLLFASESQERAFSALEKGSEIIVLDDVNTSGSTLREVLRVVEAVNPFLDIYVYTLIGRQ